jgi:hypothetical protein
MYYLLPGITSKFKLLEINFKLPEIFSLGKKAIKIKESLKIMLIFFMFDSVLVLPLWIIFYSPPSSVFSQSSPSFYKIKQIWTYCQFTFFLRVLTLFIDYLMAK